MPCGRGAEYFKIKKSMNLRKLCACYELELLNGCVRFADSGKLMFISDHGNSVVDYFIVNQELSESVKTVLVEDILDCSTLVCSILP